ncbi:Boi protein [Asimina triloba]
MGGLIAGETWKSNKNFSNVYTYSSEVAVAHFREARGRCLPSFTSRSSSSCSSFEETSARVLSSSYRALPLLLSPSGEMKKSGADLFDPRTIMDSDFSQTGLAAAGEKSIVPSDRDFAFAFNNDIFSDRVLRIEITADMSDCRSDGEGCGSIADWARDRKRRREDIKKENPTELAVHLEEQIVNCDQPDTEDCLVYENQDEEAEAMIEEAPSGVMRPETLFSNGMQETEQRHLQFVVKIITTNALNFFPDIEEAALMDLLNFMYTETLTSSTAPALLDVLMAADKFEVASCMRYCSRLLRNLSMTPESALLYLELPSSVLMAEAVKPLTDAAKQYLATRYKDITKFPDEVLNLPLAGIEAILGSDDIQVASEDAVYDFVLKWARTQYPKLEERRDVLGSRLINYIRFPYMTCRKLKKVLTCAEFDNEVATRVVLEALSFKAETPHRQRALVSEDPLNKRYVERAYKYRPVKIVEFELPYQQCIVYLDLKREECANLFPSGRVYSQAFHLGGQGFFLSAHCNLDQQSSFHCFGLFLGMQEKGNVSFAVDYEFAARTKPGGEFSSKYKGNYTFTGGKAVGYRNLFALAWTNFMAEDSAYFINGTLHLRAELTIRR